MHNKNKSGALIEEAKNMILQVFIVQPTWVNFAVEGLQDSDGKVCTVIGFPLGTNTPAVKAFETQNAIKMEPMRSIWSSISVP